jgi:hypothetical protein
MDTVSGKRDFFISYSHTDREWVSDKLLSRLETLGFTYLIDYRDFRLGAFSAQEMERSILEAKHTLVILSNSYVESEWCTFEVVMLRTLDPAARQRILLPVLREKCSLPLGLRILNYRDLSSDSEEQWKAFENDLRNLA